MKVRSGSARLGGLMIVASVIAGCASIAPLSITPASTSTVSDNAVAMPTTNSVPSATRIPAVRTPITLTGTITLTLWTAEDLAPGSTTAGKIMHNQFDAFTAANPNIHIETVLKKPYGKGGLLDFLVTTSTVVPDQLPDLAALDLSEIPQAASAGVLQPLDPLLNAELKSDFFPFAYQAAHSRGKWVALPFTTDVEHLVYNKTAVKKVPQTWDEFIKQKATLLLPVGGDSAFLIQYLSIAPLFNTNRQLSLDVSAAEQVLGFFKRARDLSLIPDTATNLKNSDEAWATFAVGRASMTQVSASRYLTERDKFPDALYAAVPTRDGKIATVATGWAFVIVTKDPARQAATARFLQWIVQGEHLAPWLRTAHRLPASRSTLILSVDLIDYGVFLRDHLEQATYVPPSAEYSKASDAWRASIAAVWRGQITPEEGARNIAATLK